jgi:hypothetical protein
MYSTVPSFEFAVTALKNETCVTLFNCTYARVQEFLVRKGQVGSGQTKKMLFLSQNKPSASSSSSSSSGAKKKGDAVELAKELKRNLQVLSLQYEYLAM